MLFHTWVFAIFFLIVYPVYLLVKHHNRWMNLWLMIASYVFYGWWNPSYLMLLFGTSAIDYLMVLFMERSTSQKKRKLWLIVSLVSNFGFLGFFKYSHFITDNINWLLKAGHLALQLPDPVTYPNAALSLFGVPESHLFASVVLPIGISFHTFQSMSYTIDAYYGNIQTERSFVRFLTFVSFFPQLVAGPIERASNLLPQLQGKPVITKDDLTNGLGLFLIGFFKKVALADYLAMYVDKVYGSPSSFQSGALVMATFAFAWQIYFDFSGYTDMARGLAQLMGFRLMLNFNNPYVATGLGDFWSRWHISLSTWFKDYVYFPLGGNRKGTGRTYVNMFVTMLISGVWHGAAWTFVIWGLLHAIGRIATRELEGKTWYQTRIPRMVKQVLVFAFVCLAWIFFRAPTVGDAWTILSRMVTTGWGDPRFPVLMGALLVAVWIYEELFASGEKTRSFLERAPVRMAMAVVMVLWLAVIAQPSTQSFIYFQF
ncbi:MAG TPA: MBOAT family O-acyltransferase [Planctomycetota bacterium]|nr:MBOAT family O-acyltransferase [Planctomycetota bacterium]